MVHAYDKAPCLHRAHEHWDGAFGVVLGGFHLGPLFPICFFIYIWDMGSVLMVDSLESD